MGTGRSHTRAIYYSRHYEAAIAEERNATELPRVQRKERVKECPFCGGEEGYKAAGNDVHLHNYCTHPPLARATHLGRKIIEMQLVDLFEAASLHHNELRAAMRAAAADAGLPASPLAWQEAGPMHPRPALVAEFPESCYAGFIPFVGDGATVESSERHAHESVLDLIPKGITPLSFDRAVKSLRYDHNRESKAEFSATCKRVSLAWTKVRIAVRLVTVVKQRRIAMLVTEEVKRATRPRVEAERRARAAKAAEKASKRRRSFAAPQHQGELCKGERCTTLRHEGTGGEERRGKGQTCQQCSRWKAVLPMRGMPKQVGRVCAARTCINGLYMLQHRGPVTGVGLEITGPDACPEADLSLFVANCIRTDTIPPIPWAGMDAAAGAAEAARRAAAAEVALAEEETHDTGDGADSKEEVEKPKGRVVSQPRTLDGWITSDNMSEITLGVGPDGEQEPLDDTEGDEVAEIDAASLAAALGDNAHVQELIDDVKKEQARLRRRAEKRATRRRTGREGQNPNRAPGGHRSRGGGTDAAAPKDDMDPEGERMERMELDTPATSPPDKEEEETAGPGAGTPLPAATAAAEGGIRPPPPSAAAAEGDARPLPPPAAAAKGSAKPPPPPAAAARESVKPPPPSAATAEGDARPPPPSAAAAAEGTGRGAHARTETGALSQRERKAIYQAERRRLRKQRKQTGT